MQSPFSSSISGATFILYLEPVLNSYYKTYQNIITMSGMPSGPLSEMVTTISVTKLSPFQEASVYSNAPNGHNCMYVLLRYPKTMVGVGSTIKNPDYYMGADDIPSVFSYLQTHGYTIDTKLTKMMSGSGISIGGVSDARMSGDRKMIAMVTAPSP